MSPGTPIVMSSSAITLLSIRFSQHLDSLSGLCYDNSNEKAGSKDDVSRNKIPPHLASEKSLHIGIVGGGMAGLYSALLLQKYIPGVKVKVLEANNRVGGNVYTYKYSSEPYQYFEAGAMRLPYIDSHMPVFNLIDYLNEEIPNNAIELIEFFNTCPTGNRLFFNGTKQKDGRVMSIEYAMKHCSELGFPIEANITNADDVDALLKAALLPVVKALENDFEAALKKYGHMSLHSYLSTEAGWNIHKINYIEEMSGPTNVYQAGLVDILFYMLVFDEVSSWKTIAGGMSKLPELCAKVIEMKGGEIVLNASVESIVYAEDKNLVRVGCVDPYQPRSKDLLYETFDSVIMTLPPPYIRLMPERPRWGADLEYALHTAHFMPASKMSLRFNTRFWERSDLQHPPSHGGRSITDLSSCCVIYPDYGVGDSGKGILHVYNILQDAKMISLKSNIERIQLALSDLQLLYPEVSIAEEYAGGTDPNDKKFLEEAFVNYLPVGGMIFNPGQFLSLFPSLAKPQGKIYFAGCHLSSYRVWIVGALESAKRAVQQLVLKESASQLIIDYLKLP